MTFEPITKQLSFVLPDSFSKAELVLIHENGFSEHIPIPSDEKICQTISVARVSKGVCMAQLNWTMGGYRYCNERMIELR